MALVPLRCLIALMEMLELSTFHPNPEALTNPEMGAAHIPPAAGKDR